MPRTLGMRRNPVKDQREEAFKKAALKLFSAKGYHRTTMEEIAHQAGFGKGTLYWYWKSKEELYFALIEDMHREFLSLVERAAARQGDAWEKLSWLGKEIVDLYYRDREYCKLSWKMRAEELETFSPQYVERLYVYINRTKEKLQEIISQGIQEGLIPPLDPYYLACMLMGLVEGMEIQWLEDSRAFDLRRAMELATRLASGLLGARGEEAAEGRGGDETGVSGEGKRTRGKGAKKVKERAASSRGKGSSPQAREGGL